MYIVFMPGFLALIFKAVWMSQFSKSRTFTFVFFHLIFLIYSLFTNSDNLKSFVSMYSYLPRECWWRSIDLDDIWIWVISLHPTQCMGILCTYFTNVLHVSDICYYILECVFNGNCVADNCFVVTLFTILSALTVIVIECFLLHCEHYLLNIWQLYPY